MLEVYRESWPSHIKDLAEKDPQAANRELFAIGLTLLACNLHGVTKKNLKEAQFRCAFLKKVAFNEAAAREWDQARKCLPSWLGAKSNATFKDEGRAAWLRRQVNGIARDVEHELEKEAKNG